MSSAAFDAPPAHQVDDTGVADQKLWVQELEQNSHIVPCRFQHLPKTFVGKTNSQTRALNLHN